MVQSQISPLDRRVISATVDCVDIATAIDIALTKIHSCQFCSKIPIHCGNVEDIYRENKYNLIEIAIF